MAFIIYLLIYISFTDLFAQLPITSTYAQGLGATTGFIGFIVGAYSLTNLFSNVFAGQVIDRTGPKKVMLLGFLLNAVVLFLYAIVTSPTQLLFVRFLNGLTAGVITPAAFTYLTLYHKDKNKGKTMAFSGAAVGLAAISGPAFSGIISSKIGPEVVYMTIGFLMLAGLIITLTLKPLQRSQQEYEARNRSSILSYLGLFNNKGLLLAFLGALSLAASQGILAYMLPLKVVSIGMDDRISGMLISVFGIVAILFFVSPTNRIFDKYRNEMILPIGLLTIAVSQTLSSFASSQMVFIISMTIYGIGFALIFPSMAGLISEYSSDYERGKAFGLFYGFISVGSFLGSSLTGMFSLTPDQGFISAAVFLLIVSATILLTTKK
ncbi:MFS transporter [Oceanobacillus piezotolerans]|uniref:MFS transporter n=1 Tax=Oceanobacillus piezotolerans TaxID=2448030 RepID=A0A498DJR1_9BACI|nr:MFS transporter [Oceanobacillus piezotolerans]RLL46712.1 MFS transporter [Oceanobacillus piezotolerans]